MARSSDKILLFLLAVAVGFVGQHTLFTWQAGQRLAAFKEEGRRKRVSLVNAPGAGGHAQQQQQQQQGLEQFPDRTTGKQAAKAVDPVKSDAVQFGRKRTAPMTPSDAEQAGLRPKVPDTPPYLSFSEREGLKGEMYRDTQDNDSNQRMTYHQISPESPRLDYFAGFWTPAETEEVMQIAQKKLQRSTVVGGAENEHGTSKSRTSHGMFITGEESEWPLIKAARLRVSLMTGLPVENVEATQVLRYEPGQQYVPHPDFFAESGVSAEHLKRGGQRVATVLAWLNDVDAGGNTSFPRSHDPATGKKYGVAPKRGDAIAFWNCVRDVAPGHQYCTPDPASTHWGEPPLSGMKWVSVFWVRQREFH